MKEEERKKREEEERIRREKEEEERKKKEEEKRIRREKEEEERKKREEEERIRREKEETERKKREEEERIKREKEEEERKKREEEERKKWEEERKKWEEEEKKRKEEEEKREKEQLEKLLDEHLLKINKKKEELSQNELEVKMQGLKYKLAFENYDKIIKREYYNDSEGRDITFNFEEFKEISLEPIVNLEVTDSGKIIILTYKNVSKIYIYNQYTYEEENCLIFESQVNSFVYNKGKIYCALLESRDNILIIPLDNTDNKFYLNGHYHNVTGVIITSYNYLVSADVQGNVLVWDNYKVKKRINDFCKKINTITEIHSGQQRIAILSFYSEVVKFYDLRYSEVLPLASIENIKGSGFQNNMLKLNSNILAIAGTYIYIIDINSFMLTNSINCAFANDCISTSLYLKDNKGFFFVSQALTNNYLDDIEKGTLGYYEYDFNNVVIPEYNQLIKKGSKMHAHDNFIVSIRNINDYTFVSGSFDGKIKFWNLKQI